MYLQNGGETNDNIIIIYLHQHGNTDLSTDSEIQIDNLRCVDYEIEFKIYHMQVKDGTTQ